MQIPKYFFLVRATRSARFSAHSKKIFWYLHSDRPVADHTTSSKKFSCSLVVVDPPKKILTQINFVALVCKVGNGSGCKSLVQDGPGWFRIAKDGSQWLRMAQNCAEWPRMVRMAQDGSEWFRIVQDGSEWPRKALYWGSMVQTDAE